MNPRKKLTILVDMDDTLEDLIGAWVDWLDLQYDTGVTEDDIKSWDIAHYFPALSKQQVFSVLENPRFWSSVEPKPGAIHFLKRLIDDGHTVYICTNSNYVTLKEKMDNMLFRFFPYLTWDNVIIMRDKQLLKADVLIDDGIHNLVGGDYEKILMTAVHNKGFDASQIGAHRADSWSDAYNIVDKISRGTEQ